MSNDICDSAQSAYPIAVNATIKDHALNYIGGATAFAVALLLRFYFDTSLPPGFPFLTFFPAVIITAFLFGTGPAILTATLGFLASWYFFIPPFRTFSVSTSSVIVLAVFVFIVTVDIFIIDRLMRVSSQLLAQKAHAERMAEERRVMYSEVQHRIGNNLQAISSLLLIQSRSLTDETAKRALMDSVQRVGAVASIQRRFHDMSQRNGLFDAMLVEELARSTIDVAGVAEQFELSIDITPTELDQERFTSVTLIMLECINNSLEHAYPTSGKRQLTVTLKWQEQIGRYILTVVDDGNGLAPDFDPARSQSIGMKVILSFTRQIGGTFTMQQDNGTICKLEFPKKL